MVSHVPSTTFCGSLSIHISIFTDPYLCRVSLWSTWETNMVTQKEGTTTHTAMITMWSSKQSILCILFLQMQWSILVLSLLIIVFFLQINYFRWDKREESSSDFYRFCRLMMKFRQYNRQQILLWQFSFMLIYCNLIHITLSLSVILLQWMWIARLKQLPNSWKIAVAWPCS